MILGLSYFTANFLFYKTFSYEEFKPLIAFVLIYISSELVLRYNLNAANVPKRKINNAMLLY